MEYKTFIDMLNECNAPKVVPLELSTYNRTNRIPESFVRTLPSIVSVLNENISLISQEDNMLLGLFGIEPAGLALRTKRKNSNRIIDPKNPDISFCCFLKYFLLRTSDLLPAYASSKAENIVLDFNTGKIMDMAQYLFELNIFVKPSIVYGFIDKAMLSEAWLSFNRNNNIMPYDLSAYHQ